MLTVLVVDDDSAVRAQLASLLDHAGHRVLEAHNAVWALELFARHKPDLVLTDVVMPAHDGYWLARQLRERETGHWTPIIFLSGQDQDDDLARGIESGGDDYLVKPITATVLAAKLRAMRRLLAMQARLLELSAELRASNQHLQHLSEHDSLTGRRPSDHAARYGGEEFALILPDTPKSGAMTLARTMQRVFETAALRHPASAVAAHVTISGGVTTCLPDEATTLEGLLMRADEALYVAKAKGRNRFFSFEMQVDSVEQLGVG